MLLCWGPRLTRGTLLEIARCAIDLLRNCSRRLTGPFPADLRCQNPPRFVQYCRNPAPWATEKGRGNPLAPNSARGLLLLLAARIRLLVFLFDDDHSNDDNGDNRNRNKDGNFHDGWLPSYFCRADTLARWYRMCSRVDAGYARVLVPDTLPLSPGDLPRLF